MITYPLLLSTTQVDPFLTNLYDNMRQLWNPEKGYDLRLLDLRRLGPVNLVVKTHSLRLSSTTDTLVTQVRHDERCMHLVFIPGLAKCDILSLYAAWSLV